jgi:two-component system sensor histidine kinase/response regulator
VLYAAKPAPLGAEPTLRDALAQGLTWKGEFQRRRKDGSEFTESALVAALRQHDGQASALRGAEPGHHPGQGATRWNWSATATSLKTLVEAARRRWRSATQAAQAANVAKSAFLANMSHEIRTPLTAITGMAYLIRRSGVTPQQAAWLAALEAGAQHLLEVINAVLDLSQIEAGKLAWSPQADLSVAACWPGVALLPSVPRPSS